MDIEPADPVIAQSAHRHGVSEEDIHHAFRNPIVSHDLEEGFVVIVGATKSAGLLEIGIVTTQGSPVVVHAMQARSKFLPENLR